MRVLIIEDQSSIRKLIGGYLRSNKIEVFEAASLGIARKACDLWKPSVVLLDVILNEEDGLDFLRERHASVKTIVFSSRSGASDRIKALEIGAFDYLSKPVDPREIYLKIQRLGDYKLSGDVEGLQDTLGDLKVDFLTRVIVGPSGCSEQLSKAEISLLRMFLSQTATPFSKTEIARVILVRRFTEGSRAVDVMVSKLRAKIRIAGSRVRIINVREQGYMAVLD